MTEILSEVWNGFSIGFKYVGIVGGVVVAAYSAFMGFYITWKMLEKITRRD